MIESTSLIPLPDGISLLSILQQNLEEKDPGFKEELRQFQTAKAALQTALKDDSEKSAEEYLSSLESLFASKLLHIAWLGVSWNLDCFRNPVSKLRLLSDYEELHGESFFNTIPQIMAIMKKVSQNALLLPHDCCEYVDKISDYYSYLETIGFKLVHYWGFLWGNEFFPKVVPGYAADTVFTAKYTHMLEHDLGIILADQT